MAIKREVVSYDGKLVCERYVPSMEYKEFVDRTKWAVAQIDRHYKKQRWKDSRYKRK